MFSAKGAVSSTARRGEFVIGFSTSAEGATQRAEMNRAFSAGGLALHEFLGRCPRLR
jgi:hypothetical protein